MFNGNLLKAKIIEMGKSVLDICNNIGICEATFYRKVQRDGDFSRFEIDKITEVLGLSISERDAIFLLKNLRKRKLVGR